MFCFVFLFINYPILVYMGTQIFFLTSTQKINSQNFCQDINSKMDYFLSLGMEKNDCKGGICSESFLRMTYLV